MPPSHSSGAAKLHCFSGQSRLRPGGTAADSERVCYLNCPSDQAPMRRSAARGALPSFMFGIDREDLWVSSGKHSQLELELERCHRTTKFSL